MAKDGAAEALGALAAAIGLTLPPEVIEGVAANLALLDQHAARLADFALPDDPRP